MDRWLREFILRWLPALIVSVSLSLPCYAEDGVVYPDTARVQFTWQRNLDTVTVTIVNLSSDLLTNTVMADLTDSAATFIECNIDGVNVDSVYTEQILGDVIPGKYSTRWLFDSFADSVTFKFYCSSYSGYSLTWHAGHPYPVFGVIPGIGPPVGIGWQQ